MDWLMAGVSIDPARFQAITARINIQVRDAQLWRDKILAYFQKFSGMPITT